MVTHEPGIAEHAERVIFLRDGLIVSDKLNGKSRGKFYESSIRTEPWPDGTNLAPSPSSQPEEKVGEAT
jgi:hypothetical protein